MMRSGACQRPVRHHQCRDDHAGEYGNRAVWHGDGKTAAAKVGALEEAHGGTLYIDEVADMPKETQAKILRVLVEQNFQRVDGVQRVSVDVRIVSSSSRDLNAAIADGHIPRRSVSSPRRRADPRALRLRAA